MAATPSWLDEIVDKLSSEDVASVVDAFVEKKLDAFLSASPAQQAEVHRLYARLYDSRIESYLKTHGIRLEEFYRAVQAAESAAGDMTRREGNTLFAS